MTDTENPQPDEQPVSSTEAATVPDEQAVTAEIVDEPAVPAAVPAPQEVPTTYTAAPTASGSFGQPAPAGTPASRRRGWVPALAAGGVLGLVLGAAGGAGAGYLVATNAGAGVATGPAAGPATITVTDPGNVTNVTAVAASAMASVVTINVTGQSASGTGSGVVLDDQGHIVTNTHVVTVDGSESSPTIKVTTSSGRIYDAKIVGMDPLMDIAVIQVTDAQGLTPVEFADSSKLNVGSTTIAIGAPLGLAGTVTSGIISALDRSIEVQSSAVPDSGDGNGSDDSQQGDPNDPFDYFHFDVPGAPTQPSSGSGTIQLPVVQTDTAINPGNSGGALLDASGKLIGINVAIGTAGNGSSSDQSGSIGVGFAIPSNVVKRISDEIIRTGTATHGLLGATVADSTSDAEATVSGASIRSLVSGGAAEKAGLQEGDVITAIDGVPITGASDATAQIRSHDAGGSAEIAYDRDGKAYTVQVTLGDYAAQQ